MKRVIAIAVVLVVAGLVAPGHSRGRTERTETVEYVGTSGFNNGTLTAFELVRCGEDLPGCVKIETTPADRFMSLELKDSTGQAVYAEVSQTIGDGYIAVCSSTKTFKIGAGLPVYVWVLEGTCDDGATPSTATTGTVTATFSNMR